MRVLMQTLAGAAIVALSFWVSLAIIDHGFQGAIQRVMRQFGL